MSVIVSWNSASPRYRTSAWPSDPHTNAKEASTEDDNKQERTLVGDDRVRIARSVRVNILDLSFTLAADELPYRRVQRILMQRGYLQPIRALLWCLFGSTWPRLVRDSGRTHLGSVATRTIHVGRIDLVLARRRRCRRLRLHRDLPAGIHLSIVHDRTYCRVGDSCFLNR
jgi:hypothetical protein